MDNKIRMANLPEEKYQITFGVKKPTFDKMLEILEKANNKLHKFGGRPARLSVLDKLYPKLLKLPI